MVEFGKAFIYINRHLLYTEKVNPSPNLAQSLVKSIQNSLKKSKRPEQRLTESQKLHTEEDEHLGDKSQ